MNEIFAQIMIMIICNIINNFLYMLYKLNVFLQARFHWLPAD